MANKRRRKRKIKPFTKILMVLIPCFVVAGVIYGIDINKTNDNKTSDIKLSSRDTNSYYPSSQQTETSKELQNKYKRWQRKL